MEWTKKRARHNCRRRLEKIKESIGYCARNWDDLNGLLEQRFNDLGRHVDEVIKEMDEVVEEEAW